jgi:hypothetical protein
MIRADAKLSIRVLGLDEIQVCEYQERYLDQFHRYVEKLKAHPGEYAGILSVKPSQTHRGMFALLDGYTRFCAHIIAGRDRTLCLVIEEEED